MARTVPGNVHSLLWKSIPINSSAGYKAEFIDVSTGMGQDVVLCMCLVLQKPNNGIQEQESPVIKSLSLVLVSGISVN